MTRRLADRQHRFMAVWFRAPVTEAHLSWTNPMNAFEVAVEIADCRIAAIGGNGLDRRGGISKQLGSPRHPHLKQVPLYGLAHFSPEQAANPGLSQAKKSDDLVPGLIMGSPTLVYHSQEYSNSCFHNFSSIIAPRTEPK